MIELSIENLPPVPLPSGPTDHERQRWKFGKVASGPFAQGHSLHLSKVSPLEKGDRASFKI